MSRKVIAVQSRRVLGYDCKMWHSSRWPRFAQSRAAKQRVSVYLGSKALFCTAHQVIRVLRTLQDKGPAQAGHFANQYRVLWPGFASRSKCLFQFNCSRYYASSKGTFRLCSIVPMTVLLHHKSAFATSFCAPPFAQTRPYQLSAFLPCIATIRGLLVCCVVVAADSELCHKKKQGARQKVRALGQCPMCLRKSLVGNIQPSCNKRDAAVDHITNLMAL
jgi:hypothetical protein